MTAHGKASTAMVGGWIILAVLLMGTVWPAGAVSFDTIDVPEAPETYLSGINKLGQMSGFYAVTVDSTKTYHGFICDGVNFRIIDIPGASNTRVYGINDSGRFVGWYNTGTQHGFIHDGVKYQTIDVPGAQNTRILGINNAGVVVGAFDDSQGTHGFVYDGVKFTTLNAFGYASTRAMGINNHGKIVGYYVTTEGTTQYNHGYIYDGVTYTHLDIPGATHTTANGINDAGTVVGSYVSSSGTSLISHGYTFNGVSHTTVDVPGASNTGLTGISNTGRLTGYYRSTTSTMIHGCVSGDTSPMNLVNYFVPSPLSRQCQYSYITPTGFPGFTLRFTPVTSGKYAGKYRMGDWNTPENELAVWRIVGWDLQSLFVYADSQIGELTTPVSFSTVFSKNTLTPNPLPGEAGIYWYFKTMPSLTVAAGTFKDVLAFIVLDSAYSPNSVNTALALDVPYAVTAVTYYARGIGEIGNLDVEAQTGNINFSYQLQGTGFQGGIPPGLQLLLGLEQ